MHIRVYLYILAGYIVPVVHLCKHLIACIYSFFVQAVGPPFTKQSIEELIDKVLAGSQLTEVLKQTPTLSPTGERTSTHDEL